MKVVYERCCGQDVHKKTVVACVRFGKQQEKRTLGTMTEDILTLSNRLLEQDATHVAMESTGEYWKPIFNLMEGNFEVILVNAQHLKRVPGRKTGVSDAQWIAELLQFGLLQASFIPPVGQRELPEPMPRGHRRGDPGRRPLALTQEHRTHTGPGLRPASARTEADHRNDCASSRREGCRAVVTLRQARVSRHEQVPSKRLLRFQHVHALHMQGKSVSAIARETGLDCRTVRADLSTTSLAPIRRPSHQQTKRVPTYQSYLLQNWNADQAVTVRERWRELHDYGMQVSLSTAAAFLAQLRRVHGLPTYARTALPYP